MLDAAVNLVEATVQLQQVLPSGHTTVGTGFLVSAHNADGSPRTILITAKHVFVDMEGQTAEVGYRTDRPDGTWSFTPQTLRIRDEDGKALWTSHPNQDVAAITIKAPKAFADAAIPVNYLATDEDLARQRIGYGEELLILGYPRGLSANGAGFPILRSGRVASYPVSSAVSPTFLLDFSVFPGNSGGPVFTSSSLKRTSSGAARPLIAGLLTQSVEFERQPLGIGVVTHARYISETIDLLYGGHRPVQAAPAEPPPPPKPSMPQAQPAAETHGPALWRPLAWVRDGLADAWSAVGRAWWVVGRLLFGAPTAST